MLDNEIKSNVSDPRKISEHQVLEDRYLEIMVEEGKKINPEIADVYWAYEDIMIPYGIGKPSGCIGRAYYARNPGGLWVSFYDIPDDVRAQLRLRDPKSADPLYRSEYKTKEDINCKNKSNNETELHRIVERLNRIKGQQDCS